MTNNTSTNSTIEVTVMRRVYIVHALRPLLSGGAFALVIFVFALWGIGREVWVARVFQNAPQTIALLPRFYLAAFEHTRLTVQVLCVAAFVSLLWFFRDLFRAVVVTFAPRRA